LSRSRITLSSESDARLEALEPEAGAGQATLA
jgi:hypothetical protein